MTFRPLFLIGAAFLWTAKALTHDRIGDHSQLGQDLLDSFRLVPFNYLLLCTAMFRTIGEPRNYDGCGSRARHHTTLL